MSDDHEAIRHLIYTYAFHLDKREYPKVASLLADATVSLSWPAENVEERGIRGIEAIERFYSNAFEGRRPSRHVITNLIIDLDESGEAASVYSYLTSVGHPPQPPSVLLSGHYEDRFTKVDGEWRFSRKDIVVELPA